MNEPTNRNKQYKIEKSQNQGGVREKSEYPEPRTGLSERLKEISIEGFKSLRKVNLHPGSTNILIGANGAGKSNFLGFFELLSYMMSESLAQYVPRKGGGDDLLFNGAGQTQSIRAQLSFDSTTGVNEYGFRLSHTDDDALVFSEERYRFTAGTMQETASWEYLGSGHREAKIADPARQTPARITRRMMRNIGVHHFHDSSRASPLRRGWDLGDIHYLRDDGGNLAPMLLDLRENRGDCYNEIVRVLRMAVPVFKDFDLNALYGKVALRWRSRGGGDKSFGAHLVSDGTLRLMALTTLLCMPPQRQPNVIVLDEPELGLHPDAITLVAAMIKRAAIEKQVFVATQSPLLLDEFALDDIIITEMNEAGETVFRQLESENFQEWLDEFKAGDLWQRNLLGGNP